MRELDAQMNDETKMKVKKLKEKFVTTALSASEAGEYTKTERKKKIIQKGHWKMSPSSHAVYRE